MKLLAPNVGWAMNLGRLMWTSNGGTEWEDITPPAATGAMISAVFFLDANHGWVLFAHEEPDVPGALQFDLVSTDNAGAAWSAPLTIIKGGGSGAVFAGAGWLAFADSEHGWLALGSGRTFVGHGGLIATSDGGRSWVSPRHPAHRHGDASLAGPMVMVTPQFGWLVGGGANDELLVTRDGAKTWQRIELESPVKTDQMREYDRNFEQFESSFQALPPAAAKLARERAQEEDHSYAAYDLPTFEDPKHGYVCVTYPGVVVLFATKDGGVTWKPDRVLTGLQEHSEGEKVVSAMADSTWITGRVPKDAMPQLRKLGPGASATDSTMPAPEASGVSQMSFATANQGWIVTNESKLLATNDGGATWTDITP
ncbi:MAG: hypothetical protein WA993_02330 [Candidatus Binatus sp.]|jgi:photosystem II stability/assembly factor-like uncharacterized protein